MQNNPHLMGWGVQLSGTDLAFTRPAFNSQSSKDSPSNSILWGAGVIGPYLQRANGSWIRVTPHWVSLGVDLEIRQAVQGLSLQQEVNVAECAGELVWAEEIKKPKVKAGMTQGGEDDREGRHSGRGSEETTEEGVLLWSSCRQLWWLRERQDPFHGIPNISIQRNGHFSQGRLWSLYKEGDNSSILNTGGILKVNTSHDHKIGIYRPWTFL